MRLRRIEKVITVASHGQAVTAAREPGVIAIVERGQPRTAVMACPDGCGEVLTVNVDPRVGKAWRLYQDEFGVTLFPSVWRDTGCECHFILWDNLVRWGDRQDIYDPDHEPSSLEGAVLELLQNDEYVGYVSIADALGRKPWSINRICQRLVGDGYAEEAEEPYRGSYRRL